MSQLPDWQEDFKQLLAQEGGSRTTKRSVRILGGPAQEGKSAWQREEIRTIDEEGNIHTFDRSWTARGLCGCVLTQETGQIICAEATCKGVVCREHAVQCIWCRLHYCAAHIVFFGTGDARLAYCRRHRYIHYLKLILGVRE